MQKRKVVDVPGYAKTAIHAAKPSEQSVLKRLFVQQNIRTK